MLCDRELCLSCVVIESYNLSMHTGNDNTFCYSCSPNFTRIAPKGRPYYCYFCLDDHTAFPGLPPCLDPHVPVLPLVENLREGISVYEASSRAASVLGTEHNTPRSTAADSQQEIDLLSNWLVKSSSVGLRGLFRTDSQASIARSDVSVPSQPLSARLPDFGPTQTNVAQGLHDDRSSSRSMNLHLRNLISSNAERAQNASALPAAPGITPVPQNLDLRLQHGRVTPVASAFHGDHRSIRSFNNPSATASNADLQRLVSANACRARDAELRAGNINLTSRVPASSQNQNNGINQSRANVHPPTCRAAPGGALVRCNDEAQFDRLLPLIDDRMSRVVNTSIRPLQQALCSAAASIAAMEKRLNSKDTSQGSNLEDPNDKCIQWSRQDQLTAKRVIDNSKPLQVSDVRQLVSNGADKITTEIKAMTKSLETSVRSLAVGASRQNQRVANGRNSHPGRRGKQSKNKQN